MNYARLINYEHLLFEHIIPNMNLDIDWKSDIQEWIDYNLHYPVYLEAHVDPVSNELNITVTFTNGEDAALFKLFWS